MRHQLRLGAAAVLSLGLSASSFGTVIFEHEGNTAPDDNTLLNAFPDFLSSNTADVVAVDGATDPGGVDAWNILTEGSEFAIYQNTGAQGDIASGILLTVDLQLLDSNDLLDIGTHLQIRTGTNVYGMAFGRSGNDVTVGLMDDFTGTFEAEHTVVGAGGNYNLFQLLVTDSDGDPATPAQGELWVNGAKVDGIAYDGFANNAPQSVVWGDLDTVSGNNGNANYAAVRLESGADAVIPEPASLALLAVGSLFLLPRRRSAKA